VLSAGVLAALVACAVSADASQAEQPARALSRTPVRATSAWRPYVIDPGAVVYPKAVRVIGDAAAVSDPDGLRAVGGGATTITSSRPGSPRLVIDLGADTGGRVELGVSRTDGTPIRLGYSESRAFLTSAGDNAAGSLGVTDDPDGRSDLVDASAPTSYRTPGVRGAERWISLQLEGAGSVSIDYVRVRTTHLRAAPSDYAGHFISSDRTLNRAWYASAYTFAMDSVHARTGAPFVVTDGAKRDRLLWLGDLVVDDGLGQYSLWAAPRIVRDSLAVFGCQQQADGRVAPTSQLGVTCPPAPPPAGSPRPPGADRLGADIVLPEYTASLVIALHDYWLYSGDDAFARRLMPVVRRGLAYFAAHMRAGLFETPAGATNWHPPDTAPGQDAHANATLYRALRDAAELERRIGGGALAAADDRRAAALRRALLAHLWDEAAGAFVVNSADPRRDHTQDAQVEAVYDGILGRSRSRRALRFIDRHLLGRYGVANGEFADDPYMSDYISPYMSSTELLARFSQGDAEGALDLIRRTWGHMVDTDPRSTVWEKVALTGLPANYEPLQAPISPFTAVVGAGATSLSHGWSGGPVQALSGYVLGIRPVEPGFRRWMVAPQPGDLRFAQGTAPTPYGAIASRWTRADRERAFRMTVRAPRGTVGVVAIPLLGAERRIWRDGRLVWDGRRARGGVEATASHGAVRVAGVRGGPHTFAWSGRGW
jgi:alpha-L-rhamnosidase